MVKGRLRKMLSKEFLILQKHNCECATANVGFAKTIVIILEQIVICTLFVTCTWQILHQVLFAFTYGNAFLCWPSHYLQVQMYLHFFSTNVFTFLLLSFVSIDFASHENSFW